MAEQILRIRGYVEVPDNFNGDFPDLLDNLARKDRTEPDTTQGFRALVEDPWRTFIDLTNPLAVKLFVQVQLQSL